MSTPTMMLVWITTPSRFDGHFVHESSTDALSFRIAPAGVNGFTHYVVTAVDADTSTIIGRFRSLDAAKAQAQEYAVGAAL